MTEQIDGAVKITEEELTALNKDGVDAVDDAALQALADKSGDTVEHIKEMLNLADGKVVDKKDDDTLLAGKYKTEGDLDQGIQSLIDKYGKEEAYKMLESSIGKAPAGDIIDKKEGDDALAEGDALTDDDAAAKAAADAAAGKDALSGDDDDAAAKAAAEAAAAEADGDEQINFDDFYDEFADKGELSIESYKKLEDAGYHKDLVDGYIQGQEARSVLFTNDVHALAGGEAAFDAMVEWGSENLTEPEKVRFNDSINSNDLGSAKLVIEALKGRYAAKEGTFKRGRIESSDSIDGSNPEGYASPAEMSVAMRDPRYRTDPAYVKMVETKVKNSTFM